MNYIMSLGKIAVGIAFYLFILFVVTIPSTSFAQQEPTISELRASWNQIVLDILQSDIEFEYVVHTRITNGDHVQSTKDQFRCCICSRGRKLECTRGGNPPVRRIVATDGQDSFAIYSDGSVPTTKGGASLLIGEFSPGRPAVASSDLVHWRELYPVFTATIILNAFNLGAEGQDGAFRWLDEAVVKSDGPTKCILSTSIAMSFGTGRSPSTSSEEVQLKLVLNRDRRWAIEEWHALGGMVDMKGENKFGNELGGVFPRSSRFSTTVPGGASAIGTTIVNFNAPKTCNCKERVFRLAHYGIQAPSRPWINGQEILDSEHRLVSSAWYRTWPYGVFIFAIVLLPLSSMVFVMYRRIVSKRAG